jgi:phenylacetate-CoA ligase
MFVQPSQVNRILENLYLNNKARLIVSRLNEKDELHIKIEADISDSTELSSIKTKISEQIKHIINLRGTVEIVPVNSLPNDGKVIDDIRDFGE